MTPMETIGWSETHGELTGENMDILDLPGNYELPLSMYIIKIIGILKILFKCLD